MRNLAAQVVAFQLPEFVPETHAELSGLEPMLVPTIQIKIDPTSGAVWHRRGPEESKTACGETYLMCAIREYRAHVADLCSECFTKHERSLK